MDDPLALYIHWPFCVSKCPYCDFNSHVRDAVDQDAWRAALLADLAHEAAQSPGRTLGSIFFGGGTPSLIPPSTVEALIAAAGEHWSFADDIEITLEANPSSVEAARFGDLAQAGVNRVSLGLQSLDDDALRFLGRAHSAAEGLAALDTAQNAFDRVSFDLIYALPDQEAAAWRDELEAALALGAAHMSLYQLTIEPGTRFATLERDGRLEALSPDDGADLFALTNDIMRAAGLPGYEISNHAKPGQESRHNLTYWRYGDYAGVGPGAHGRRRGMATMRHKKPENWIGAVERNDHGLQSETPLGDQERATEALMMGLRLTEGIDRKRFERVTSLVLADFVDADGVSECEVLGLIDDSPATLRCTEKGLPLLDAILPKLI
ncbi:MAG: coproporphyrinogen III oxidase [Sphingomonadaceae bacterium]|nr:coproporphyrinogen III oxidase [Sphingomonadaceae bacterium]